jgi:hypothetical protein
MRGVSKFLIFSFEPTPHNFDVLYLHSQLEEVVIIGL